MAVLTPEERDQLWREFSNIPVVERGLLVGMTKWDFRAVFDALDAFLESHTADLNQAFPLPAKTLLSAKQKAWCYEYVIRKWRENL